MGYIRDNVSNKLIRGSATSYASQNLYWNIFFAVWCRRTDELVDGPNADYMSSAVLDRWEDRLHDIFNGHPYDMLDAALTDTVTKFPLDIKVITKTS